jgi:hexosaminidase
MGTFSAFEYNVGRLIRSHKTEQVLPLDGDLTKWQSADRVVFEGSSIGGLPRRAAVCTLWDNQNLYLCFDVSSSKLQAVVRTRDGDNLWLDDGVEFLIDPQRHRTKEFLPDDFAYHINILNAVFDDRGTPSGKPDPGWDGNAQHEVKLLGDFRYAVEVAVPWKEISLEPHEEQTIIGVDFCVNGRDPQTGEYDYFDWCGLKVFHDPSGFGDLMLRGPRQG